MAKTAYGRSKVNKKKKGGGGPDVNWEEIAKSAALASAGGVTALLAKHFAGKRGKGEEAPPRRTDIVPSESEFRKTIDDLNKQRGGRTLPKTKAQRPGAGPETVGEDTDTDTDAVLKVEGTGTGDEDKSGGSGKSPIQDARDRNLTVPYAHWNKKNAGKAGKKDKKDKPDADQIIDENLDPDFVGPATPEDYKDWKQQADRVGLRIDTPFREGGMTERKGPKREEDLIGGFFDWEGFKDDLKKDVLDWDNPAYYAIRGLRHLGIDAVKKLKKSDITGYLTRSFADRNQKLLAQGAARRVGAKRSAQGNVEGSGRPINLTQTQPSGQLATPSQARAQRNLRERGLIQ
jgi:hypothetical protein